MKTCTKCGCTKEATEFHAAKGGLGGLKSQCKACAKTARAKWYEANKDQENEASAKWRADNLVVAKACQANWRAKNQEKANAMAAAWQKANPEACRIHHHNRRAREREAIGNLSAGLADKLFRLQRGKCACGCSQPLGADFHRDHIMPLALGGSNTDDNIQLLRSTCNLQKKAKHPVDFMQQRGFLL